MTVDMKKTGVHIKELFDKKNISVAEIQKELGLNHRSLYIGGTMEKHCRPLSIYIHLLVCFTFL